MEDVIYKDELGKVISVKGRRFVCHDKNKKRVFENDSVLMDGSSKNSYIVKYDARFAQWFFENENDAQQLELDLDGNCPYIELINDENGNGQTN